MKKEAIRGFIPSDSRLFSRCEDTKDHIAEHGVALDVLCQFEFLPIVPELNFNPTSYRAAIGARFFREEEYLAPSDGDPLQVAPSAGVGDTVGFDAHGHCRSAGKEGGKEGDGPHNSQHDEDDPGK